MSELVSEPSAQRGTDAASWDRAYAGASLDPGPAPDVALHPQLAGELAGRPPGRGLELACGEGRPSIGLARDGWTMTAVDFSAVAIGRGRRIARAVGVDVDWVVADVTAYAPEPDLDLVLVAYLHIEPGLLTATLRRAAAALAPGGSLLVLGWDRTSATGPAHRYGAAAIAADVRATVPGIEIVRADRIRQHGNPDAHDALVHLRGPGD